MKLTAKLAKSQLIANKRRTILTLLGIILSVSMITAVFGFVLSAKASISEVIDLETYLKNYRPTLMVISGILVSIIIIASVIVISNAFSVSAGERTRQFGLLKSVGATKTQIRNSVIFEGVYLSIIGIPIGVIVGLAVELVGVFIANSLLAGLKEIQESGRALRLDFAVSALPLVFAAVLSFLTVLLSAWFPARRAARIPAIDAIRQSGEVKIKAKQLKTSKLTQKLFGPEGALAAKSLKRSKRSYRATVISLVISIVLFMVSGSFETTMSKTMDIYANVTATVIMSMYTKQPFERGVFDEITKKLASFPGANLKAVGKHLQDGAPALPENFWTKDYLKFNPDYSSARVNLISVDRETYSSLCKQAGVNEGGNILVNTVRARLEGKHSEFVPFNYKKGQSITVGDQNISLDGQIREATQELYFSSSPGAINVIVPEAQFRDVYWFSYSPDSKGFADFGENLIKEISPQYPNTYFQVQDIAAVTAATRNLSRLVMVFIYGFVAMLTLIGVTNVISAISTNIRTRAREFAVLKSIGMTRQGLKRMMNLESLMYGFKSLVIGIPLGSLAAFGVFAAMNMSVDFDFVYPWANAVESVVAVFLLTFVTMRFASKRVTGESIVETIRGE